MFREHIAIGAIISMVVVVGVYFYALVTDPWLLVILFGVTIVGSFLPDVDSDSSMPFYLVFGTATLVAGGIVLLYTLSSPYAADWRTLIGIPAAALLFFWFVIGGIVKRYTKHRGIFHSLPALAIAGVGTFLLARHYGLDDTVAWVFGAAIAIGFASHLVLDEIHAGVTLDGIPFNPKNSLGSAIKMFSRSTRTDVAAYLVLAALMYSAFQTPVAQAYFYNDSEVIEIGDGTPQIPEGGEEDDPGGSGGGGGGSGGSSGTSGGGGGGSGSGSGGGSGGGTGGTGDEGESLATLEELLQALIDAGAILGLNISGSGGTFDSGTLGTIGGSAGIVSISGDAVREAFQEGGELADILRFWRPQKNAPGSAAERGLIAASTALRDANVESVSLADAKFEIVYRSRGYLLIVIPWSFPVTVEIEPEASSPETRVKITLPWYRFFVRKFFTTTALSRELNDVVVSSTPSEGDVVSSVFQAVSEYLKKKVGTIADSIYLGTPQ